MTPCQTSTWFKYCGGTFKRAADKQMPENLNELRQSSKEEWAKISPQWYQRLIKTYRKPLLQMTAVQEATESQDYKETRENVLCPDCIQSSGIVGMAIQAE